jgi:hypothetical protein
MKILSVPSPATRLDLLHPRLRDRYLGRDRRLRLPHNTRVLADRREVESVTPENDSLESAFFGEPAYDLDEGAMGRAGRLIRSVMLVRATANYPVVDLESVRAYFERPARGSSWR